MDKPWLCLYAFTTSFNQFGYDVASTTTNIACACIYTHGAISHTLHKWHFFFYFFSSFFYFHSPIIMKRKRQLDRIQHVQIVHHHNPTYCIVDGAWTSFAWSHLELLAVFSYLFLSRFLWLFFRFWQK